MNDQKSIPHVDAVIVGAGFAGLYLLHKLKRSGLNVQVFEAATENIKQLSHQLAGEKPDELTIATTPTQARYVLPDMLLTFQQQNPGTALRLHQDSALHNARVCMRP